MLKKRILGLTSSSAKVPKFYEIMNSEYSAPTNFNGITSRYREIKKTGDKKLVLGVTTGRSGMKWVYQIFNAHSNAQGGGERNVIPESFYRYIKHNHLPIDYSGILDITRKEIMNDWIDSEYSITVSPYFSHDCKELYEKLMADYMIWGITDPKFTVTSCLNKGVYLYEPPSNETGVASGFDPHYSNEWSHFFGRIVPQGDFLEEWKKLTRVGKISWFLNTINKEIFSNVEKMDKSKIWIFDLAKSDQKYSFYLNLAKAFNLNPSLSERQFLSLKKLAVYKGENVVRGWTSKERSEFEYYAKDYIELYKSDYFRSSGFMNSER